MNNPLIGIVPLFCILAGYSFSIPLQGRKDLVTPNSEVVFGAGVIAAVAFVFGWACALWAW